MVAIECLLVLVLVLVPVIVLLLVLMVMVVLMVLSVVASSELLVSLVMFANVVAGIGSSGTGTGGCCHFQLTFARFSCRRQVKRSSQNSAMPHEGPLYPNCWWSSFH